AAGDAKRNVQHAGCALHPVAVHATPVRTGGDVVEHQFVRTLVAVAQRQLLDAADIDVVAKAHALDHATGAHVQAGNHPTGQHARASARLKRRSSKARPSTTARAPVARNARTCWRSATPPDATRCSSGCDRARDAYSAVFGPDSAP